MSTFGPDYVERIDGARIDDQMQRIRGYMQRSGWRTLSEIELITGDPQASISAQLRHLRKAQFGSWVVAKRRRDQNAVVWEYMLVAPDELDPIARMREGRLL